jgi:hypothetical protein
MEPEQMMARLAEPFDAGEVKWKPQTVKGNRALAVCYIDARLVMDRLDEVFGVGGWQDEYSQLPNGSVLCRLSVKIGGEWVAKTDVGSESEQPDEHDRTKAAFSDALKRTAVKFGIGRYLYRLGHQWCDYDVAKRQFASRPQLPKWAMPGPVVHQGQLPAYPEKQPEALPAAQQAKPKQEPAKTPLEIWERMGKGGPKTGEELFTWLERIEASLKQMGTPSYAVFDGVMSFLDVAKDTDIKGVTVAAKIEGAWANARQFVKLQSDLATAKR